MGENPPSGALLSYWLPAEAKDVSLEVLDSEGTVVARRPGLPTAKGMQRASVTSLTYPSYRSVPGMVFWAAGPQPIPAPPGVYTLKLTVDGQVLEHKLRWLRDPRAEATDADLVEQSTFTRKVSARVNEANDAVLKVRDLRSKLDEAVKAPQASALADEAKGIAAKLTGVEEAIYQTKMRSGQDPLNYPIRVNNKIAALLGVVLQGQFAPTDQAKDVFDRLSKELQVQLDALRRIVDVDLKAFNEKLTKAGGKPIS
jgi:hypothetical protein